MAFKATMTFWPGQRATRAEARQADSGQNVQENHDASMKTTMPHRRTSTFLPRNRTRYQRLKVHPPPAKIFRKGQLMYHAAHKGPVPVAYVDTGLYLGGKHDYYEAPSVPHEMEAVLLTTYVWMDPLSQKHGIMELESQKGDVERIRFQSFNVIPHSACRFSPT
jgi:hypothetical protein